MAQCNNPVPVKYFIAILYHEENAFLSAIQMIKSVFGEIDFEGEDHLFDVTDYYEPEMGKPLYRRIVSLEDLNSPQEIVSIKLKCNEIENVSTVNSKRIINCDAGYLDHNKILLASAKDAGQKVYLDKGIYADLAARYKSGSYQPFEWSFPDFKDGRYDKEFLHIRRMYMLQIKEWRKNNTKRKSGGMDNSLSVC